MLLKASWQALFRYVNFHEISLYKPNNWLIDVSHYLLIMRVLFSNSTPIWTRTKYELIFIGNLNI